MIYYIKNQFQVIMKDKWMNLGCEDDELKPYVEPEQDFKEPKRIGTLSIRIMLEVRFVLSKISFLQLNLG